MPLAIEIRNGFVNLVDAGVSKNDITLKHLHHFSFDENWINEEGIVNVDEFSALLKSEITKTQIKDKHATICINSNAIIYRELTLPAVDERKIPLLVRSEMMNNLNLTPDFTMDYVLIEEIGDGDNTQYRVLAVALHKNYIESIIEVLKEVGLKVKVIDSAANSIMKFVQSLKILPNNQQVLVVDVEENYLRQYLFENGHYALTRNNRIDEVTRKNKADVVVDIVENINKMIQFSYTRGEQTNLSKILLTGSDDVLSALKKQVTESLAIECEIISPESSVKGIKYENRYVNAMGSLMRMSK